MDEPLTPKEALDRAAVVFNNLGEALTKALAALSKLGSTNKKKIYPPDETEHKYIYGGRKKKKK